MSSAKSKQNFLLWFNKDMKYNFCSIPLTKDQKEISQFVHDYPHLQNIKVCICEKGCTYSEIQLFTLPIAQQNVAQDAWGRVIWKMIHTVARHHHSKLTEIFDSLLRMLPCITCRNNFSNEVKEFKHFVCTKQNAEKAAWNLHNKVSANIKKPQISWETYLFDERPNYAKHIDINEVLLCLEMQVRNSADLEKVKPLDSIQCNMTPVEFLKLKMCRKHLLTVMEEIHSGSDTVNNIAKSKKQEHKNMSDEMQRWAKDQSTHNGSRMRNANIKRKRKTNVGELKQTVRKKLLL